MKEQRKPITLRMKPATYYIWCGGSCNYASKSRESAGAYIMEKDGKQVAPTEKTANQDLILECIAAKQRHHEVKVKIVSYHKYSQLPQTHEMAHEAMMAISIFF